MSFYKFIGLAVLGCVLAVPLSWAATNPSAKVEKETEKLICDKTENVEKVLAERGYFHLLNMTNSDKVVESLWVGGQSATIVAKVPNQDTVCVLAVMSNVIYNSDVINDIYKNMEKQTKQKDI